VGYYQQVDVEVFVLDPVTAAELKRVFDFVNFDATERDYGFDAGAYESLIYEGDGLIGVYREDAPKWEKPLGIELTLKPDVVLGDEWFVDLKAVTAKAPGVRMVLTYRGEEPGDEERLTIEDGRVTKTETLDWVEADK